MLISANFRIELCLLILFTLVTKPIKTLAQNQDKNIEFSLYLGNNLFCANKFSPYQSGGNVLNFGTFRLESSNAWSNYLNEIEKSSATKGWYDDLLYSPNLGFTVGFNNLIVGEKRNYSIRIGAFRESTGSMVTFYFNSLYTSNSGQMTRSTDNSFSVFNLQRYLGFPVTLSISPKGHHKLNWPYLLLGYKYCKGFKTSLSTSSFTALAESSTGTVEPITLNRETSYFGNTNQVTIGFGKDIFKLKLKKWDKEFPIKFEATYSWGFGYNFIYAYGYEIIFEGVSQRYVLQNRGRGFDFRISCPVYRIPLKKKREEYSIP